MFGIDGLLLVFLRKYWLHIVIALAFTAWNVAVFWAGGRAPRAELEQERAERQAAEDMFEMQDQLHDQLADAATEDSNKELANAKERLNRAWAPLVQDLEKQATDARRAADAAEQRLREHRERAASQPVPGPAVCTDGGSGSQGLPDAVERFVEAERGREAAQLADATRQLQVCQAQTDRLINGKEWAARQRVINQPFRNPLVPGQ